MRAELAGNAGSDGEVLLRSRPITLKDARAWVNLVAIILITEMASGLRMMRELWTQYVTDNP